MMDSSQLEWLKWLEVEKRKMARKTDAELLDEMKEQIKEKKEFKKLKNYKDNDDEKEDEEDDEGDEIPRMKNPETQQETQHQIMEREINLALINDKLNFIISKLQQE